MEHKIEKLIEIASVTADDAISIASAASQLCSDLGAEFIYACYCGSCAEFERTLHELSEDIAELLWDIIEEAADQIEHSLHGSAI